MRAFAHPARARRHGASRSPVAAQPRRGTARSVKELALLVGNRAFADAAATSGTRVRPAVREPVERQLGIDLSAVRLHTGEAAAVAADAEGAHAVTSGLDIMLGRGASADSSRGARGLIAHELAHVAQWLRGGSVRPGRTAPGDAQERHAAAVARDAVAGEARSAGPMPPGPVAATSRQERPGKTQPTGDDVIAALAGMRQADPQRFLDLVIQNEMVVYALLSRYGFHGSWVDRQAYLADFDRALANWLKAGNMYRLAHLGPIARGPLPLPQEDDDQPILAALPDGTGFVGPRRSFRAAAQRQYAQRALQTLDNIRSGPGGAVGYLVGGDRGSDLGASVDGVMTALGGVAQGRAQMRSVSSAQPSRPVAAEVRPLESERAGTGRTPEQELREFQEWSRRETGSPASASGGPLRLLPYAARGEAGRELNLPRSVEAMHGLPQAVGRGVPGYEPRAALTTLGERVAHTELDRPMKEAFQHLRRAGRTTASGQEVYDIVANSIRRSPLNAETTNSLIARLADEMFVEFGMQPQQQYPLPYPNIKPAKP